MADAPLYVFIDESGDFNFSLSGTKFYTFTAVITHGPWEKAKTIIGKRHQIISGEKFPDLNSKYFEESLCSYFHACEDKQIVRDEFFKIIQSMKYFLTHSIVVRKNRTNPSIRDPACFYPKLVSYLIDYIQKTYLYSSLCIFVDNIPVKKQKQAFLSAMKTELKQKLKDKPYKIYFPPSCSNSFLQVSDYVNWAIFRKWERGDYRSYDLIKSFLKKPELDIFRNGDKEYY